MIKLEQAVIVEGKYDRIKLESILDAVIIETDGFSVFKDKEKQRLIRRLADKRGILILTDSDSAGFLIRGFIGGSVDKSKVFHAYIPDILGKEKRKAAPSKEGKLGVEGVGKDIIIEALSKAGVLCSESENGDGGSKKITPYHLYEDGFSGGKDSKKKRALLLKKLDFPENISTPALIQLMNAFMSEDEYHRAADEIKREISGEG